ncbi:MAG: 4-(cytidine 5'-diphospho)-2-C-methyl-D-erythritol kinase [Acidimicrobiales bacterium]
MSREVGGTGSVESAAVEVRAPAKLTLSLEVTGVRPDGYHLLAAEFVTVNLFDTLYIAGGAEPGLTVTYGAGGESTETGKSGRSGAADQGGHADKESDWLWDPVSVDPDNLIRRALETVGVRASIRLVKRIPPGAGLGGGSADAAAVLRWAGRTDVELAASLGADVPFCLTGGRARVSGIGEMVEPLPHLERTFTLLVPPFGMDTAAVYKTWDELASERHGGSEPASTNDLEAPSVRLEPRLLEWKEALAAASGRHPQLAGSGSTWFVEGPVAEIPTIQHAGGRWLRVGSERGLLAEVTTTPRLDAGGRSV